MLTPKPNAVTIRQTSPDLRGHFICMKRSTVFVSVLLAAGLAMAQANPPVPALPLIAYEYAKPALPAHALALAYLDNTPASNPLTNAGAALGRVLFYDRGLSKNGLVSCASCHSQSLGFDDPTRFSIGHRGKITRRSAMALANARYNPAGRYFHDLRAARLEDQALVPFTDPVEMGLGRTELVERVSSRLFYAGLFTDAFGDPSVSEERISRALAQFVRSMVSFSARYDEGRKNAPDAFADFASFTAQENRGKFLFMTARNAGGAGCAECHESGAFVLVEPRNNGLPPDPKRPDGGVGEASGHAPDIGKFRAASLRNIAVSAPYMHDGRFRTLDEVIEHYAGGVVASPTLAPQLRNADGSPARLVLPVEDRAALAAFLQTLTDDAFLANGKFSDPFARR